MTFKSKIDRTFTYIIMSAISIVALATLVPVVYELWSDNVDVKAVIIISSLFVMCVAFILWLTFDIEYSFKENYLFIKGGPFRSKIPYEDITKVNKTSQILAGYRILSSKDAIEIHYKKASLGSVIISPSEQQKFLLVLSEKAPHISLK